jgi:hypothetical protein
MKVTPMEKWYLVFRPAVLRKYVINLTILKGVHPAKPPGFPYNKVGGMAHPSDLF